MLMRSSIRLMSKIRLPHEVVIPTVKVQYKTRSTERIEFDSNLISHLEKLSLVRFSNEAAVINLREAVTRANRLLDVNVKGLVEMDFVWENESCELHEDVGEKPLAVEKTLSNASKTLEDFFVTPPGNVPLEESGVILDMKIINK